MKVLVLTFPLLLASCATLGIGQTDAGSAVDQVREDTCKVWLPISFDSTADTEQTVKEVRANNRAREAYCK